MGSRVTIRRLRVSDGPAFRELRLRALAADRMAFGSTLEEEEAESAGTWDDRVLRGATSAHESTWVVEREDGRLAGMVVGVAPDPRHAQVFGMWVDPELRGTGVGARLLDTLLRWAEGISPSIEVRLCVNPAQRPAVQLYLRHGFVPTGAANPLEHTPGSVTHEMVRRPRG